MSDPRDRRSGTETRKRRRFVAIRLSDEEHARVRMLCDDGQSVAALVRQALLASPLPRRRKPRVDQLALASLLSELQAVAAEMGKHGSNLNQLAHQANADRMPVHFAEQLADALEEHAEQGRTLLEIREACLAALGFHSGDRDL